ncbi:hypothetical protein PPROV_000706800 [Pycnococcus provasolii]|uniref:FAD/NAD(P)-binding domain-containing protein n=1 Tax=Pycnococcus provasolii TaxID=41880 RepID=A0A830HTS2_9CHLO|nr:hypothetical protein PPROV_000706800 [Pycnococcus provasolii]
MASPFPLLRAITRTSSVTGTPMKTPHVSLRVSSSRTLSVVTAAAGSRGEARSTPHNPPRICIVGGGFGGLYTALRLDGLSWPAPTPSSTSQQRTTSSALSKANITLVDAGDRFVFKPLMYELLTGEAKRDEVAPLFADLLDGTDVNFARASVTGVTMEPDDGGIVHLDDETSIPFDYLVVALGNKPRTEMVPGARSSCLTFSSLEDVDASIEALDLARAAKATPRVAVVGGGVGGAELAAAIATRDGNAFDVTLLCRDPTGVMPTSPSQLRDHVSGVLRCLDVTVRAGASVTSVAGDGEVTLSFGGEADDETYDVVFWCAGQEPATTPVSSLVDSDNSLPVGGAGAPPLEVNPALQATAHPRVFAIGDIAQVASDGRGGGGGGFAESRTAQVAFQQSDYVAWNVWALHYGRPLLPFRYQHLGEMLALGPGEGAVAFPQLPEPLGDALGTLLDGWAAGVLRKAAYVYRQPTNGQRLRVLEAWARRPELWLPPGVSSGSARL